MSTRKERRDRSRLHGVCRNCGEKGRHFAPPGFGSPGVFICKAKDGEPTTCLPSLGEPCGVCHRCTEPKEPTT